MAHDLTDFGLDLAVPDLTRADVLVAGSVTHEYKANFSCKLNYY